MASFSTIESVLSWSKESSAPLPPAIDFGAASLAASDVTKLVEYIVKEQGSHGTACSVTSLVLKRCGFGSQNCSFASNHAVALDASASAVSALAELLRTNQRLRVLDLWGCDLTDDDVRVICKGLVDNQESSLTTLNLGYNSITTQGARVLADCCCRAKSLRTLTLGSSKLPVRRIYEAGTRWGGDVKLSNLGVGPLSAIIVGLIARRSGGVTSLDVSGNALRKEGTDFLCKEMAHETQFVRLDISRNEIFPSGASSVAAILRGAGGGLEWLSLADNNITNWAKETEALRTIVSAACDCGTLKVLRLEGNVIQDDGAACVAELIASSSCLEELNLSRAQIASEGGIALGAAISRAGKKSRLKILNLGNNSLGSRGATPIVESICEAGSGLQNLNLQRNNIPKSAAVAMLDALANNRDDWCLSSIDLEGNRGVPLVVQEAFQSLPELTPNRYGIMSGVDRMKKFKVVREVMQQEKETAEKRKLEMAKSPLRPPSKRPISPLGSGLRASNRSTSGNRKLVSDEDSDGYDEGAHMDIYADSEEEFEKNVKNTPVVSLASSGAESKSNFGDQPTYDSPKFKIDIDSIQFPASGISPASSSSKPSPSTNTERSSRIEHSDRSQKAADQREYDSEDSDDLSPRTLQLMRSAYAEMGGNRIISEAEEPMSAGRRTSVEGKESGAPRVPTPVRLSKMMNPDEGSLNLEDSEDSNIIHVIGGGTTAVPGLAPAVLGGTSRRARGSSRTSRGWASSSIPSNETDNREGKEATVLSISSAAAPSVAACESPPPKSPRAGESSRIVLPPPSESSRGNASRGRAIAASIGASKTDIPKKHKRKPKTREQMEQERREREEEERRRKAVYDSMQLYRAEKAKRLAESKQ